MNFSDHGRRYCDERDHKAPRAQSQRNKSSGQLVRNVSSYFDRNQYVFESSTRCFMPCQSLLVHAIFDREPLVFGHFVCSCTHTEESIGKDLASC